MPVISSPTRSRNSSSTSSRSASRTRWRMTCLAVIAAMRPKPDGVTSCSSMRSRCSSTLSQSSSGRAGRRPRPSPGRSSPPRRRAPRGVLLEVLRDQELVDAEVGRIAVELDAGVLRRSGLLAVRRQEGILEGFHQGLGRDALLGREGVHRFKDLARHRYSPVRLACLMSACSISSRPWSVPSVTARSSAATISPRQVMRSFCGAVNVTFATRPDEAGEVRGARERALAAR